MASNWEVILKPFLETEKTKNVFHCYSAMKNILIIGGATGTGAQLAQQLAQNNYAVFASYNKTKPEGNTAGITYFEHNALSETMDVSLLPDTLHGLVYCPGSINLRPFARIKPEDFLSDYNLNVVGAVKVLQAILPKLKNAEQGSVVFFSTIAAQMGLNFHTQVAASKSALEGLTKALAAEFSPKIRVNCIAPSLTDTPLSAGLLNTPEKREASAQRHPLKKIGTAADMANMAEFLLSDKSSWITGQIFHVDGGLSTLKV